MTLPEPFKIHAPEGEYFVEYEIDLDSLAFPIICKPAAFTREMIRFLNTKPDGRNHIVNVLLIERNEAANTYDVVPLLVNITFIPHGFEPPLKDEDQEKEKRTMQFRHFIDLLTANGELDYLHKGE